MTPEYEQWLLDYATKERGNVVRERAEAERVAQQQKKPMQKRKVVSLKAYKVRKGQQHAAHHQKN